MFFVCVCICIHTDNAAHWAIRSLGVGGGRAKRHAEKFYTGSARKKRIFGAKFIVFFIGFSSFEAPSGRTVHDGSVFVLFFQLFFLSAYRLGAPEAKSPEKKGKGEAKARQRRARSEATRARNARSSRSSSRKLKSESVRRTAAHRRPPGHALRYTCTSCRAFPV